MINIEYSEFHNEATRTMTHATASAQTAYGCHDVLRIREDSGRFGNRRQPRRRPENTDRFETERSKNEEETGS
jgi:hypothetical protein